jgi:CubicO group peptidase (beta-lactamase class C family)
VPATGTDGPEPAAEMATAIVVDGKLAAGGLADPPVPWWSFTKTVLAAAALVLVELGRLSLDAPLAGRAYTLRQLLQHRAGVPEYGALEAYHAAVACGDTPWPVTELLARVKSHVPVFEPGKGWLYSNVGYLFVRQIIEDAADEGVGQAVTRLVLAPLGISHAGFAETPDDLVSVRSGIAAGYHPGWVYHGLLIGPPAAAALLLDRLMTGDLLSSALLRAMQDGFRLDVPIPRRPWQAPSYGLGLMIEAADACRFVGHTGGGPSSTVAVYRFPGRARGVTVTVFAPVDDQSAVEQRAVDMARDIARADQV